MKILVCYDGSDVAADAVKLARQRTEMYGANLILMKALPQSPDLKFEDIQKEEASLAGETAAAHLIMAKICRANGELDRAEEYAVNSLQLRRKLGDQRGQSLVTYNLALIQVEKGNAAAGLELAQESVAISRRLQDLLGISYGMRLVGDCHSTAGALDEAREAWQTALDIAQQLKQTDLLGSLQQRLAQ